MFSYIKKRARQRIQGRKGKLLSQAGKEILMKLVVAIIPSYAMSCFLIPKTIYKAIKSSQCKFWWGSGENEKKINWIARDKMQNSNKDGGLSFRDLHHFNLVLLAKHAWRIIQNLGNLWARLLKSLYFVRGSFLCIKCKNNCF